MTDLVRRPVNERKQTGYRCHQHCGNHAQQNRKECEFPGFCLKLLCSRLAPFSQPLSHYNGCSRPHGDKGDIENISQGLGNIECGHNGQTAHTVALRQHGLSPGPQGLVRKKRGPFLNARHRESLRHIQTSKSSDDKWQLFCMRVRPDHDKEQLCEPGYDSCSSCAHNSKGRRAEFSENKDIISQQIHAHCNKGSHHGRDCLLMCADNGIIGLRDCERQKAHAHDCEISCRCLQGQFRRSAAIIFLQVQTDQLFPVKCEDRQACHSKHDCHNKLQAEGPPNAFMVLFPAVLSGENPDPRESSEHTQVPYKKQGVHDRDARHRIRADSSDHNIVQHIHKIRDAVLKHDRQSDRHSVTNKFPVKNRSHI